MDEGFLAGIAFHIESRGEILRVGQSMVTKEKGVLGDRRGLKKNDRQITLLEYDSWVAALEELGIDEVLPWYVRRANLFLFDITLPRTAGTIIRIGETLRIQITGECDPCKRMDEIHDGLQAALKSDWRGGFTGKVITDGEITIGDRIVIEET